MPKFFNKKTATVRFHGFNEEKKYQNSKSDIIVSKRLIELIAVTLVLIFIFFIKSMKSYSRSFFVKKLWHIFPPSLNNYIIL